MPDRYIDSGTPLILWFRYDLRLADHPGVASALAHGRPIIPLYIYDEALGTRALGAASKWWLGKSLNVLHKNLERHSSRLIVLKGETEKCLNQILDKTSADTIICSRTFDPKTDALDQSIKSVLANRYVDFEQHNATLLTLRGFIKTRAGLPFKVFTPFYRMLREQGFCGATLDESSVAAQWLSPNQWPEGIPLDDLRLTDTVTPTGYDWTFGFNPFVPGEAGARAALSRFIDEHLWDYAQSRDRPDKNVTSHLSPHLRFGEISPQRILSDIDEAVHADIGLSASAEKFRSELAWREFCYQLLQQKPDLHQNNFRQEFDAFPWNADDSDFEAWRLGATGYDLVDAGMKEMWRTGYMHNRVRMVCASFLVKHLLIDWRRGEQWFWDCLLDADPASNPANWQWVAGSGADAAPYFRIFNPIAQADKFDPAGHYRNRYKDSCVAPIIDHSFARQRALDAYRTLRSPNMETSYVEPD